MRVAIAMPVLGVLAAVGILLGACSGESEEPSPDLSPLSSDDSAALRSLAEQDSDEKVDVQVSLNEPQRVDELVDYLTDRDLELLHVTSVLLAGGQQHSANMGVEVAQAEFPNAYANKLWAFAKDMIFDLSGRLGPDCLTFEELRERRGLPDSASSVEVLDGEAQCASDLSRSGQESTLSDFEAQIDEVRQFGYPIYAMRVSGRSADLVSLLEDGMACAIALPGPRGPDSALSLPSPHTVGRHCWESYFPAPGE